jgi:DNA-binding beta-propeller fold protein YncE
MRPVHSVLLSLVQSAPKSSGCLARRREVRRRLVPRRLHVEALEDRTVPTVSISVAGASLNEIGDVSGFVASGSGGLSAPKDLVLGPDGNVYVASSATNSVIRYNGVTGQLIGTFVASGSGGLGDPFGLAFGPDGNLYVGSRGTTSGTNSVYRYNGTTGRFLSVFVSAGSGGLNDPIGMTFGPDGNLYVSSFATSSVMRYQGPSGPSPGSPLPAAGQTGATFVATGSGGLAYPAELTFGPHGNLYVSDEQVGVREFDAATGGYISTFTAPGAGGSLSTRGIAFDQDGRLYVADAGTNSIHRFDSQGSYLDDPVVGIVSSLHAPIGITFDAQGALLISGRDTNTVGRYDRGVIVTLSATGAVPVSVAYATADGAAKAPGDYTAQAGTVTFAPGQVSRRVLLVTHEEPVLDGNETFGVQLSNATGASIAAGSATVTIVDPPRQLNVTSPAAPVIEGDHTPHYRGPIVYGFPGANYTPVTLGPDGYLYTSPVGGPGYGSIQRFDPTTGAFIDTFVQPGRIHGVSEMVFQNGYLYVASWFTNEVLRFDGTTGAFVDAFVTAGSGGITAPNGLAFGPDANGDGVADLYVTGANSNNVVRYDGATGQPLGTYITPGSGGLSFPLTLAFGPDALYVTSPGTNQILKYNSLTGAYLGVAASAGLSNPRCVRFGPDGLMYVVCTNTNRILRFTAAGAYVDDYVPAGAGGMSSPDRLTFGPDGDSYVSSTNNSNPQDPRFGTENEAVFTVSISTPSTLPMTVSYATGAPADTAVAGRDYTATSGTLTFPPGVTSETVRVPILDDGIVESNLNFTLNLASTETTPAQVQGTATIADGDAPAKFYVVNDATTTAGGANATFRYQASGSPEAPSGLSVSNLDPRGVASNAAGTMQWVVDANKNVFVYSPGGALLGSWSAAGLGSSAQLTGITTNGSDIWLVDATTATVYKYAGAASRLSGSQSVTSSFALFRQGKNGNSNPQDIVTDGTSFWVVDGSALKVFKYTLSGSLLGSWAIDPANTHPTGITINPNNVSDVWIVDTGTLKVYDYTAAAGRTSGSQNAASTFALNPSDTNPQGIADPPPADILLPPPAAPVTAAPSAGPLTLSAAPSLTGRDAVFALLTPRSPMPAGDSLGTRAGTPTTPSVPAPVTSFTPASSPAFQSDGPVGLPVGTSGDDDSLATAADSFFASRADDAMPEE